MSISLAQAKGLFTKKIVAVYQQSHPATTFLMSFFKETTTSTRDVSIEVERYEELIAEDIQRGADGNFNTFGKSTEKMFTPHLYDERFAITDLAIYETLANSQTIDAEQLALLAQQGAKHLQMSVDKITRSYELQCSQVLQTGIVTSAAGSSINFKRKNASIVDSAGDYWSVTTVDPTASIATGAKFLREVGKMAGDTVNVIMGELAFAAFLKNPIMEKKADIRNYNFGSINEPIRNAVGSSYHGTYSCGSFIANIWTYPQSYKAKNGTTTPYINSKNIVILPANPTFNMAYAAVPKLIGQGNRRGKFVFDEYIDEKKTSHEFAVKSAGLAIPTAVDRIYTQKVLS
jgi:hypothetical protein